MLVTWIGCYFVQKRQRPHKLKLSTLFFLSVLHALSISFGNLSLSFNTLSLATTFKISATFFVLLFEVILLNKKFSSSLVLCVVLVVIGVLLITVENSSSFLLFGTIFGLLGAAFSSLSTVWSLQVQKRSGIDPIELMSLQAPLSGILLLLLSLLFDSMESLGHIQHSSELLIWVFMSGILGLCVTISIHQIVSATSPLTYNIISHCKTIALYIGGVLFFGDTFTNQQMMGLIIAMLGVFTYSYIKLYHQKNIK